MKSGNRWPLFLICIGVGFLALLGWSFHRAGRDVSAVTDRDYYNRGLRFEQTRQEQKTATALGWTVEPSLDGRKLLVLLRDARQQPVTAARGELTLSAGNRGDTLRLPLQENSPGSYQTLLPSTLHGEQAARIGFEHDGARLNRQWLLVLP